MRLFLIRHGETVDNVAGVYAGVRDSALTNHGVLQANRLGQHLQNSEIKILHIFSSDLQRAYKTAEAIRKAQIPLLAAETRKLTVLREQDFGFYEGKPFIERPSGSNKTAKETHLEIHKSDPGFQDVESREAMKLRSSQFVEEHLVPLFHSVSEDGAIVVVAHGIILSHLWRAVLSIFSTKSVSVAPGAMVADRHLSLEHLGGWSNTGFLDLTVHQSNQVMPFSPSAKLSQSEAPPVIVLPLSMDSLMLSNYKMLVNAVNSVEHLKGLKKTRGGIGSSKYDEGQKTMESFFKKRKLG